MPFTPIAAMLFVAVFMFVGYPLAWLAAGGWMVAGWIFSKSPYRGSPL